MNTKKNKKGLYIGIALTAFVILCVIGIRIYLHANASKIEALREYALSNGPWAEQSVWTTGEQKAYLLSQNKSGEQLATVTAYFCLNEAWYSFRVNMTYGNTLIFSDTETLIEQFSCDFSMKDTELILFNLKAAKDGSVMPTERSYVFSKAENYDEVIPQLPFDVASQSDILQVGIRKATLGVYDEEGLKFTWSVKNVGAYSVSFNKNMIAQVVLNGEDYIFETEAVTLEPGETYSVDISIPYPVARQDGTNNVKITAATGDTTATYKESFSH